MAAIELTIGASTVELPAPSSAKTEIIMAIDNIALESGTFGSYDNGEQFDKRTCLCSFLLPVEDQADLNLFLFTTPQTATLTLTAGCGFFPFGPDKGDDGEFTVAIVYDGTPKIGAVPFRYCQVDMIMTNTGEYPAYSPPAQLTEGPFTIGTVSGLRMPEKMFNPDMNRKFSIAFTENSTPHYVDNESFARYVSTSFIQNCNESNAAALLQYLVTIRTTQFTINSADYFYPFGADYDASGYEYVILSSNKITITHTETDQFDINVQLRRE
jgi:hypothetical protein